MNLVSFAVLCIKLLTQNFLCDVILELQARQSMREVDGLPFKNTEGMEEGVELILSRRDTNG